MMNDRFLRTGIFLAPFHALNENPTLAIERDMDLVVHLDKLNYHEAWSGFYASAGLTTEQIARFEALMMEAEEVKLDFFATARAQGVEPSAPELAELRAEAAAELTRALHELLGEQGYQQFQRLKRALPLDVIVEDTAKLLASRAPLAASQRSRLLDTLASADPSYESGSAARLETIDWSRALAEAQTYLSPAQVAVLQQEADLQAVYAMVRQFYGQNVVAPLTASAGTEPQ
jgi:hypothetical protein